MNHGLSERQLAVIREILSLYADEIVSVDLYGSRAAGTHRPDSDVDLVLHGTVEKHHVDRLRTLFIESSLPFSVDLTTRDDVAWPPLKRHVTAVARPLFTREDLKAATRTPEA